MAHLGILRQIHQPSQLTHLQGGLTYLSPYLVQEGWKRGTCWSPSQAVVQSPWQWRADPLEIGEQHC